MRFNKKWLFAILALAASTAQAAEKGYTVKYLSAILEDGTLIHEPRRRNFPFRMEIVGDSEDVKFEGVKNGYPFVTASNGERYSVRLYNPLPVRVAVNLTVDGLNSISGKPSGISDGEKWMIDAYGSITVPGWQVNSGEARRFFFTDKPKSYAKWRGDQLGQDLEANCGVIGAAYFWNQRELDQYYEDHPSCRYTRNFQDGAALLGKKAETLSFSLRSDAAGADSNMLGAPAPAPEAQEQAGTGMGESGSNPTYQVDFKYDTGMYDIAQAVVIYYGFADSPRPNPFPSLSYAPEMP
jgi:hypothetical protein